MDYIVRNREEGKKPKRRYFTKEVDAAIIKYNNSTDIDKRNALYEQYMHYPFYKLTQNIIHTFKFRNTDVPHLHDLQHQIIIFLVSKLHLFDPSTGKKAYSYFGTITLRWLIQYDKDVYKKKITHDSVSHFENDEKNPLNDIKLTKDDELIKEGELDINGYKEKDKLSLFIDLFVEYCTSNIYELFPPTKKGDKTNAQIADCILQLFRKRDNIINFKKKAIYANVREYMAMNGVRVKNDAPKITKISKKLYTIFQKHYIFYLENGYLDFE